MAKKKKSPEEVFTPRSPKVNKAMYVGRPELEDALKRGLRHSLHLALHGESGSGKTWLYKKVLEELGYMMFTANLANAVGASGGIDHVLNNIVSRTGAETLSKRRRTSTVGANIKIIKGNTGSQREYDVGQMDSFERCLEFIRKTSGRKKPVLVLENLESIFDDPELLKQLGRIIILLDDENYARHGVKILIVGVPGGLREYYQKTKNLKSVANRIRELTEVSRLTEEQCCHLIRNGFIEELGYPEIDIKNVEQHISYVTDRLPQRLHEYCLELAMLCEDKTTAPNCNLLELADSRWLDSSLSANYYVIEAAMNERETKIGRRNQVLYALAKNEFEEFKWTEIEDLVRKLFPRSCEGKTNLNIAQILSGLANLDNPIIKRTVKGDAYRFVDPKYRMCLRAMLYQSEDTESVERKAIGTLI